MTDQPKTCSNCKYKGTYKGILKCCYTPPFSICHANGWKSPSDFPSAPVEPNWTCDAWAEDTVGIVQGWQINKEDFINGR